MLYAAGRVDVATRGAGPRRGVLASSRSFQATRGKGGFDFLVLIFLSLGPRALELSSPFRTEGVSVHGGTPHSAQHRAVRGARTGSAGAGRTLGAGQGLSFKAH